jgi:NADH dehydrogenase
MADRNIVVVGGGFAGTALTKYLHRRLPPGWGVILLSEENYVTYTPLLAEVAGASLLPGHAVAPIRQLSDAEFYRARVTAVDPERRLVHYEGWRRGVLPFEHLVLAFGMTANLEMAAGMAEHALPLKTLGDALHLRNQVLLRLEEAELEPDPEAQRVLRSFVVIGGSFSGTELAGALADLLRAARRYYPGLRRAPARVTLVEAGDRLLPEFPASLGEFAARALKKRGVEIRTGRRASRVSGRGITLAPDESVAAATVATTVGFAPNPLAGRVALPQERGRLKTNPDLSVPDHDGLWALGDCASVVNAYDGRHSPPTAQFAVRQARTLADNIARKVSGRPRRPFRYRPLGQLASIGHRKAVANVAGINISGLPAWLLWRAFYLSRIPTLTRKVQVFIEWTWQLLFPQDVTQLHFRRTRSVAGQQEPG